MKSATAGSCSFYALGTTAVLIVADDQALPVARALLEQELAQVDEACSRFRPDSELVRANAHPGEPFAISELFADAVHVALTAAEATDGLVDPTLGAEIRAAGYDRTFSLVCARDGWAFQPIERRTDRRRSVELDRERRTLRLPRGVELDLGATTKAWAADRAAQAITTATGSGVLVSLGGDIAIGGAPPDGGWPVLLADDHAAPLDGAGPVVSLLDGGLATSGTSVRRWSTDAGEAHHILDPRTGRPAVTPWRTVSVAARTCVDANVAATAAIVLGESALDWLDARALPARLVRTDGVVERSGGWPAEAQAA